MQNTKGKIICLVGESGSGKSALYDMLRDNDYNVIDSYTTRPPRKDGELGHTFVSPEEFDALRGDLLAYTNFNGFEYGTTHEQFKNSHFYIIDPDGVDYLADQIGRDKFKVVYIYCSERARFSRMKGQRGETQACIRLHHDRKKFRKFIEKEDWNYILHNEYPEQLITCFRQLEKWYRENNLGV
jgi:guanylate kinase